MQADLDKLMAAALSDPSRVFDSPTDVAIDTRLTAEQKLSILERWELDARELSVAEEENMTDGERNRLGEVLSAKRLVLDAAGAGKKSPGKV